MYKIVNIVKLKWNEEPVQGQIQIWKESRSKVEVIFNKVKVKSEGQGH